MNLKFRKNYLKQKDMKMNYVISNDKDSEFLKARGVPGYAYSKNWLQKISQVDDQQLIQEYHAIHRQIYEKQRSLRDRLNQQAKTQTPATTYVEQMKRDHEIEFAIAQLNKPIIEWLQSNMPRIWQINDPKTRDNFIQELDRLQKKPQFDPTEYEDYFDTDVLEWYLDNNLQIALELAEKHAAYEEHSFPTGKKVITIELSDDPSEWYIVETEGQKVYYTKDAYEWVRDNADNYNDYYPEPADFWEDIGPGAVVYHGTVPENVQPIMKHGLKPMNKTRGISNRSTGTAVFATWNEELTDSYGTAVFEIDLAQMKQDGCMPPVEMETPVSEAQWEESLAHGIGLTDYYAEIEQGIDMDTVVIYGTIPPKYLRLNQ